MSMDVFQTRLETLEAESAIRRLVARYFAICDDLGPDTPFEELAALFTPDAVWEGRGRYADAFGRYAGRESIIDMVRSYCMPAPHFEMTGHFFGAEDIAVEAETASGNWMMLQTSDYADSQSDFRAARLSMRFVSDGTHWRIAHFITQNIFSRKTQRWNDKASIPVPENSYGTAQ